MKGTTSRILGFLLVMGLLVASLLALPMTAAAAGTADIVGLDTLANGLPAIVPIAPAAPGTNTELYAVSTRSSADPGAPPSGTTGMPSAAFLIGLFGIGLLGAGVALAPPPWLRRFFSGAKFLLKHKTGNSDTVNAYARRTASAVVFGGWLQRTFMNFALPAPRLSTS